MTTNKAATPAGRFGRSVSLLSWAYNEEESKSESLDRDLALLGFCVDDWEIVLVNDCSSGRQESCELDMKPNGAGRRTIGRH